MSNRSFFYFLSFLEGVSVMAAELLGAKMLAPYFGTSLYVWSSVLAVTLGGLAMGYFAGGIFSEKKNTERNLYYILLVSAVFLIMMPMMAKEVMIHTAGFSLLVSIVLSSFIFLFPPVFFMGMVSPMIVQCLLVGISNPDQQSGVENSGKAAGTVYGISTLGGILATFLFGFYLIPIFGLTIPAIAMGVILGLIPFVKLIASRKYFSLIILPIAVGTVLVSFNRSSSSFENSDVKILYSSEGLLGQIIVADYPTSPLTPISSWRGDGGEVDSKRILFVNRSTQTIVTIKDGKKSFFDYVELISKRAAPHPSLPSPRGEGRGERRKALVLGLGGGSVVNTLLSDGFQVDAVELDERMADIARKYFDLDPKANIHIDDARHFINIRYSPSSSRYAVIVLDAFIGESNPNHLFTTEFFSKVQSFLSDSGMFFINGNGYWHGETGKGMRSVCKTLINSGFDVEIVPTDTIEDYRNLVFIAEKGKAKKGILKSEKIVSLDLDDAIILSDEKPQLEILNAEANKRWREGCMRYFLSGYYSGKDKLLFK
ncbi:MAG: fused MFS/spermidine synthase [Bacteroidetes bacterium]|nr:fused MFS/spermidine synthase [Bacteroidota bacterium]